MKTTVVPAQITTVEDKIAGNLSMLQISLLTIALFSGAGIYTVLPKSMELEPYKIPLIILVPGILFILSLRLKGRVIFNWLLVIAIYYLSPRMYLFNKNDTSMRDLSFLKNEIKKKTKKAKKEKEVEEVIYSPTDQLAFERLFIEGKEVRLIPDKKGVIRATIA